MKPDSVLYQTFVAADRLRVQALKDGASRETANDIVAKALEQAWPKGREKPWQYLCEACGDTGWEVRLCGHGLKCQRTKAHQAHDFVQHCWCAKGQLFHAPPRSDVNELAAVGKVRKPSRFGER